MLLSRAVRSSCSAAVSTVPDSVTVPFCSRVAVAAGMLTKPASLTVKSASSVRTGMPLASAGAAAWLAKSIEPSSAKPWVNAGTTVASKSRLALGRLFRNACGLMPTPFISMWSILSLSVSANGCSADEAVRLMSLPASPTCRPMSRRLPLRIIWFSTATSSSTPVVSIWPASANGEAVASESSPPDWLHGVCSDSSLRRWPSETL